MADCLCRRTKPGLRPQHLAGLRLIAELSAGALQGGAQNSCAVVLEPQSLLCRNAVGDTGTAGSCALLAQVRVSSCEVAQIALVSLIQHPEHITTLQCRALHHRRKGYLQ